MLSKAERDGVLYFVKLLSLRDFIDETMHVNRMFTRNVRNYSNLLTKEIDKQINVLFKKDIKELSNPELAKENELERSGLLDQYVAASSAADLFFQWGMEMSKLKEEEQKELLDEIKQIFQKYGLKDQE